MANIDLDVLNAAHRDGLFKAQLSKNQREYVRSSILIVWEILEIIGTRAETGIDGLSIAEKLNAHYNTTKMYLRWMRSKKLITCVPEKTQGTKYVFYSKDK